MPEEKTQEKPQEPVSAPPKNAGEDRPKETKSESQEPVRLSRCEVCGRIQRVDEEDEYCSRCGHKA